MNIEYLNERLIKDGSYCLWFGPIPKHKEYEHVRWTDEEFLKVSKTLHAIEGLRDSGLSIFERAEFVYYHSREVGLFRTFEREIEGDVYTYGIQFKDYGEAQAVGWFYIDKIKEKSLERLIDNLQFRLGRCSDDEEKIALLEHELSTDKRLHDINKKAYEYGYITEKSKDVWHLPQFCGLDFTSEKTLSYIYYFCGEAASGAASYLYEREVAKMLKALKEPKPVIKEDPVEDVEYVDSPRYKLLMFHELGLLHPLRENLSHMDKTQFARLFCLLAGITGEKSIQSVRKETDSILYGVTTSKKDKGPFTAKALREVAEIMQKVGYKVKNLPDFDE